MTLRILTPAMVLTTLVLSVAPAAAQHRGGGGSSVGHAVPRAGVGPHAVVGPHVVGPGRVVGVAPFGFYRPWFYHPYYAFHPRFSLGFGLWAGYPVGYPYYGYYGYPYYPYYAPYPYAYPPAYGYPDPYGYSTPPSSGYSTPPPESTAPNTSVGVQPGTASGGVSFEITPSNAAVFVDGTYVGTVGDFGPRSQPLGLTTERHHIEIRASGYHTMTFDADIVAGQVIPYQGTMQPGN